MIEADLILPRGSRNERYIEEVGSYYNGLQPSQTDNKDDYFYGLQLENLLCKDGALYSFRQGLFGCWKFVNTLKGIDLHYKQADLYERNSSVGILLYGVWVPVKHILYIVHGSEQLGSASISSVCIKPLSRVTSADRISCGISRYDFDGIIEDSEQRNGPGSSFTLMAVKRYIPKQ